MISSGSGVTGETKTYFPNVSPRVGNQREVNGRKAMSRKVKKMVGASGIEPPTTTMSKWCADEPKTLIYKEIEISIKNSENSHSDRTRVKSSLKKSSSKWAANDTGVDGVTQAAGYRREYHRAYYARTAVRRRKLSRDRQQTKRWSTWLLLEVLRTLSSAEASHSLNLREVTAQVDLAHGHRNKSADPSTDITTRKEMDYGRRNNHRTDRAGSSGNRSTVVQAPSEALQELQGLARARARGRRVMSAAWALCVMLDWSHTSSKVCFPEPNQVTCQAAMRDWLAEWYAWEERSHLHLPMLVFCGPAGIVGP